MPCTRKYDEFIDFINEDEDRIKVLAEGDSWLAYPLNSKKPWKNANLLHYLRGKDDLAIYNISSSGDEAVDMISGEDKNNLLQELSEQEYDILLFSGGGNDIVGKYDFSFFLKEYKKGYTWKKCINERNMKLKMTQVISTYELMCRLVRTYSKNKKIKIVTHVYDFLNPSDIGVTLWDKIKITNSWIKPYMDEKKITDPTYQLEIVKYLLTTFKQELQELEEKYNYFYVTDTHETVSDNEWHNEIHPNYKGIKKLGDKIYIKMKKAIA